MTYNPANRVENLFTQSRSTILKDTRGVEEKLIDKFLVCLHGDSEIKILFCGNTTQVYYCSLLR